MSDDTTTRANESTSGLGLLALVFFSATVLLLAFGLIARAELAVTLGIFCAAATVFVWVAWLVTRAIATEIRRLR